MTELTTAPYSTPLVILVAACTNHSCTNRCCTNATLHRAGELHAPITHAPIAAAPTPHCTVQEKALEKGKFTDLMLKYWAECQIDFSTMLAKASRHREDQVSDSLCIAASHCLSLPLTACISLHTVSLLLAACFCLSLHTGSLLLAACFCMSPHTGSLSLAACFCMSLHTDSLTFSAHQLAASDCRLHWRRNSPD